MDDRADRRRARLEAQRRARRRSRRAPFKFRSRWALVAVVALAAVGGVAGLLAARNGSGDADDEDAPPTIDRSGSTAVADAGPVDIARTPDALRVVYRVETGGGTTISVVTDTLTTRRPFESRLATRSGAPPGSGTATSRVGWLLGTATVTGDQDASIIEVAPGPPPTDLRIERVVAEAVARGVLERREIRRVVGRLCQVYRSRETLAAPIRLPAPEDHVDSCIDEAGIVLEEVVTVGGDVLTRRVAVEVEESPADIADDLFNVRGVTVSAASGGGFVRKVRSGTPPGEFFVLDESPEGFEYVGRYSVVPSQPENFGDDPLRESFRRAGVVDLWRRGIDIITVDQGGTLRGAEAFPPVDGAPSVDVSPFGAAELILSGAGIELRIERSGGRYLRIAGTVPIERLLSIAAGLRAIEGTSLELES